MRSLALALALAGFGCTLGADGPATPGSPAAEGATRATELAEAAAEVQRDALAVQAMSDPEQVAAGADPPRVDDLKRALSEVEAGVAASRAALSAVEELAGPERAAEEP